MPREQGPWSIYICTYAGAFAHTDDIRTVITTQQEQINTVETVAADNALMLNPGRTIYVNFFINIYASCSEVDLVTARAFIQKLNLLFKITSREESIGCRVFSSIAANDPESLNFTRISVAGR